MPDNFIPMTQNGYKKIEQEIEDLKQNRPTLIKALAAARALGDLSENAEYSSAKRDLRRMEGRLRYLEKQLNYAQIIKHTDSSVVDLGSKVMIQFIDDDFEVTYELVGKHEADVNEQKISFASPLGSALMHHKVDDIVTVSAPDETYQVKIINID